MSACVLCGTELVEARVPGQRGAYQLECPVDRRHDAQLPYTRRQSRARRRLAERADRSVERASVPLADDAEVWWG